MSMIMEMLHFILKNKERLGLECDIHI